MLGKSDFEHTCLIHKIHKFSGLVVECLLIPPLQSDTCFKFVYLYIFYGLRRIKPPALYWSPVIAPVSDSPVCTIRIPTLSALLLVFILTPT